MLRRYRDAGESHTKATPSAVRPPSSGAAPQRAPTDRTGNPGTTHGASVHRELVLLVEAGLSPREALTVATSAPADAFGLTDRGRIRAGLHADLILVEGDPTIDVEATIGIKRIWRAGVEIDREAFREEVTTSRAR